MHGILCYMLTIVAFHNMPLQKFLTIPYFASEIIQCKVILYGMVWNYLELHGMPCYMIVLLKLHHLLGMASAEFRLGRVTHSCEGLCQSGDRGMVSRHSAMSQRKISNGNF